MGSRESAKARTREQLLSAARSRLHEHGGSALVLRDVARDAQVVPSAVYRHFASRDDLLTHLIVESYEGLATTLEAADPSWGAVADGLRRWALANPHEFHLLYGTPVPGYRAPQDTVGPAARVASAFLVRAPHVGDTGDAPSAQTLALHTQLRPAAEDLQVPPEVLARTLADLSQLLGLLLMELGGHLVGSADPADHLWAVTVAAQQDRSR